MYCLFRLAYHRKSYIVIDAPEHTGQLEVEEAAARCRTSGLYSVPRPLKRVHTPRNCSRGV